MDLTLRKLNSTFRLFQIHVYHNDTQSLDFVTSISLIPIYKHNIFSPAL